VFTDPPYNVPIDGHATGLGAIRHRSFAMAAGEMSRPGFAVFLATSLRHLAAFSAGGALLYLCIDWRHLGELLAAGQEADARLHNLCVWVKDNAGMGSLYRSQHELILVFRTGRGRHRNNVQLGRFGLIVDAILDCTSHGDIVLDGFLGSGTTVIAEPGGGATGSSSIPSMSTRSSAAGRA
jgi:DNA modification methylase